MGKMTTSPDDFFKILIFWVVRGAKGQKNGPNNYIRLAPYIRNSVAYDHDF